jgi:hypothetical protein
VTGFDEVKRMTHDEVRKLPDDELNAKVWLAVRDPSERRRMCMFFTPPEYTRNFNELYEAEKALSPEQYSKYVELILRFADPLSPELEEAVRKHSGPDHASVGCAIALRATSRQRTEALAMALREGGAQA